jgi:hypothetical protein
MFLSGNGNDLLSYNAYSANLNVKNVTAAKKKLAGPALALAMKASVDALTSKLSKAKVV